MSSVLAQEHKVEEVAIEKLLNQSISEFNDAKYDKALEYSKQALVKAYKINDNSYIAQSYNTLGCIYNECSESYKAIEFYNKALSYSKKVNNDKYAINLGKSGSSFIYDAEKI